MQKAIKLELHEVYNNSNYHFCIWGFNKKNEPILFHATSNLESLDSLQGKLYRGELLLKQLKNNLESVLSSQEGDFSENQWLLFTAKSVKELAMIEVVKVVEDDGEYYIVQPYKK
jgi:hypothetical protein